MADRHRHEKGAASRQNNRKRLFLVLALTVTYMFAEFVGALWTNSLALLSDAGHMLTDVAAILLALIAMWFSSRPITAKKTYGYYRMEILAALVNGVALVAISMFIGFEAFHRIKDPPAVAGLEVMLIASGGLLVNCVSVWILHSASTGNLNLRGVFLHVLSDMLGSVGVMVSGFLIWRFGWSLADPLISIGICLLIVFNSWQLIRESVNVLLEGTPSHINIAAVLEAMHDTPGVLNVHDLHVWTISSGNEALSAHVAIAESASHAETLTLLQRRLRTGFSIGHLTIQVETGEEAPTDRPGLYQIISRRDSNADASSAGGGRKGADKRESQDEASLNPLA